MNKNDVPSSDLSIEHKKLVGQDLVSNSSDESRHFYSSKSRNWVIEGRSRLRKQTTRLIIPASRKQVVSSLFYF